MADRTSAGAAKKRKTMQRAGQESAGVVLLSGGNPQIAKGYGDGPVQAYIAAMPGWKSALGRRLDALIERSVPGVRKRSSGTRPSTVWKTMSGSSASTASRAT